MTKLQWSQTLPMIVLMFRMPSSNDDIVEEPGNERSVDTETPGESVDCNEPEEKFTRVRVILLN